MSNTVHDDLQVLLQAADRIQNPNNVPDYRDTLRTDLHLILDAVDRIQDPNDARQLLPIRILTATLSHNLKVHINNLVYQAHGIVNDEPNDDLILPLDD
jgi:hypothetical protein